jgi:Domain of unknown function DUF11
MLCTAVPAGADVPEVQVTVAPATVEPGATVHVEVTLNNVNGFTVLGPAALVLSGPADLMSFTTLAGCDAAGGCTTGGFGGGPIGYKGVLPESISGGGSATVGFDITVSASAPSGTYSLKGQLVGSNYASPVVDGPDLVVLAPADVTVGITATSDVGPFETKIAMKVTVGNAGPGTLSSATVTTTLPRNASATSSDCTVAGTTVTCTAADLAPGASKVARFSVPVRLLAIGPQTFTATRTASAPRDPRVDNNSATVRCNVLTRLLVDCGSR